MAPNLGPLHVDAASSTNRSAQQMLDGETKLHHVAVDHVAVLLEVGMNDSGRLGAVAPFGIVHARDSLGPAVR